jgi:hypothetical protein
MLIAAIRTVDLQQRQLEKLAQQQIDLVTHLQRIILAVQEQLRRDAAAQAL